MEYKLSKSQKRSVEALASLPGEIRLYKETSLSGKSETLRYSRRWVSLGRYGSEVRSESHMILSVAIREVRNNPGEPWRDSPQDIEKYNSLCKIATELFNKFREAKE